MLLMTGEASSRNTSPVFLGLCGGASAACWSINSGRTWWPVAGLCSYGTKLSVF